MRWILAALVVLAGSCLSTHAASNTMRKLDAEPVLLFPTSTKPVASIIIAFHNDYMRVRRAVESVLGSCRHVPFELILVNDGSTEPGLGPLLNGFRNIRVLEIEQVQGYGRAVNMAAKVARGSYVVLLSHAATATPGWLTRLLDVFATHMQVGAVVSKIVTNSGTLHEAGGIMLNNGTFVRYGEKDVPFAPPYSYLRDVDFGSACGFMISTEVLRDVGYLDVALAEGPESYATLAEYALADTAFAIRSQGLRVMYQPLAEVQYWGGVANEDTVVHQRHRFVAKWRTDLLDQPDGDTCFDVAKDRVHGDGMHVLVMDLHTPFRDADASQMRMFNFLRVLREKGCHVTFAPHENGPRGYNPELAEAGVEEVKAGKLALLDDRGSIYPVIVVSGRLVFEQNFRWLARAFHSAKIVYDAGALDYLASRLFETSEDRAAIAAELNLEVALMRRAHSSLVSSEEERAALLAVDPNLHIDVLGRTEVPEAAPITGRSGVLFCADFRYAADVGAVEWYVDEVHPLVRKEIPDTSFFVVSSKADGDGEDAVWLPERLQNMQDQGVASLRSVTDVRRIMDMVRVVVAPLRVAAGREKKVWPALETGVPVVTTAIGALDLGLRDKRDVLIADDPEVFARMVARLLRDDGLWRDLSLGGKRHVQEVEFNEKVHASVERLLQLAEEGTRGSIAAVVQSSGGWWVLVLVVPVSMCLIVLLYHALHNAVHDKVS